MLTTKNRVGIVQRCMLIGSMTWWLAGCTPSGPRALLDGERLLAEGKIEEAVQRLERAVRLIPDNAQAWNHLGLAYHRAGRFDPATQAYQQALAIDRELIAARFNLGCLELERGNPQSAIPELSAYLAVHPGSTNGWLKLGAAQLRARQTDSAEQSFRQALRIDGRLSEGLNGLGLVQVQRRRYPEAYQQFQAATRVQPDYAPALRNAAIVAHQFLKNRPVALERYQDLLSLSDVPDRESIQTLIEQIEDALKPVEKPPVQEAQAAPRPKSDSSVAAVPKNAGIPSERKVPAPQTDRVRPAASPTVTTPPTAAVTTNTVSQPRIVVSTNLLRPAVVPEVVPEVVQTPKVQPETSIRESEPPAEEASVETAPVGEAVSPFPRYRRQVMANLRKGDRPAAQGAFAEGLQAHTRYRFSEAISAYQRAIQSDPSFFDAHYNLGIAAFENGDLPLALSAYETSLAIQPDSLKARFNFASTLEQAGYPQDAAEELEKLVVGHPSEVRVHAALANLYARKLGAPGRARGHYLRVLELDSRHPDATAIRYWLEENR